MYMYVKSVHIVIAIRLNCDLNLCQFVITQWMLYRSGPGPCQKFKIGLVPTLANGMVE